VGGGFDQKKNNVRPKRRGRRGRKGYRHVFFVANDHGRKPEAFRKVLLEPAKFQRPFRLMFRKIPSGPERRIEERPDSG